MILKSKSRCVYMYTSPYHNYFSHIALNKRNFSKKPEQIKNISHMECYVNTWQTSY